MSNNPGYAYAINKSNCRMVDGPDADPDNPSATYPDYSIETFWPLSDGVPPIVPLPAEALANAKAELLLVTQLAANQKSALNNRIGVINDAIEFGEATDAEVAELPQRKTQLDAWKRYAVALSRVTAQAGWYETVVWPVRPAEGMDLSVDPVGRAS